MNIQVGTTPANVSSQNLLGAVPQHAGTAGLGTVAPPGPTGDSLHAREGLREITYREAIKEALREELLRDPGVFLIGEDIGPYGGTNRVTEGLWEEFGADRIMDTPISESAIVGTGLGAAITGFRPVVEIMFIDFVGVCMDQLANQVAKARYMTGGQVEVPMVIRTPGGAGRSAAAQHSQSLEAWFAHTPGFLVAMPSDPWDAKGLLKAAIREDNPVLFIEHKMLYNTKGPVPDGEYIVPLGVANVKREGTDLTIVATSRIVAESLAAALELEKHGVSAEVVDPRTLVPLDTQTILSSVAKTGRVLVVHEGAERCGFGSEVVSLIAREAFDRLDAPPLRLGARNTPVPFSPTLERYVLPNRDTIAKAALSLVGG